MILAHGQKKFPRNACALLMAERQIFVSTINEISTPAAKVLSKNLCSLNGRKGSFIFCTLWYKHIDCRDLNVSPTISRWQAYSPSELRADDNSTIRADVQLTPCALSMASNVGSCVEGG
jgi:hypothetical protein